MIAAPLLQVAGVCLFVGGVGIIVSALLLHFGGDYAKSRRRRSQTDFIGRKNQPPVVARGSGRLESTRNKRWGEWTRALSPDDPVPAFAESDLVDEKPSDEPRGVHPGNRGQELHDLRQRQPTAK